MAGLRSAAARCGAVAVVAALMVAYVAGYVDSASIQDTARDVYYAYAIRHGLFLPVEGPILGGALHLGPVWFYLLAAPLWIHESWLATALFAGAIASLKFPLAYACGTRMLDRGFGVLWAVCLAAPGWTSFETLIFFNPNAAAASVLLALWLALRIRDHPPSPWECAGFGLACALALHIHPTTAPVGLLALAFVASARRAGASPVAALAMIALGAAIPFVPYVASQWVAGLPDWKGAGNYVAAQVHARNVSSLPDLLAAVLVQGPAVVAVRIGGLAEPVALGFAALLAAPLAALALALVAARSDAAVAARRVAGALVAGGLVFGAWIALLRPTTPVYFVYALAPFTAGLLALGLRLFPATWPGRTTATVFAAIIAAAGLAIEVRMASIVRHGEGVLTSQVLDVREARPRLFADTWFPASGREALGRFLCAQRAGVAVHGHLAFVVDRSVGVDALFACGSARHVALGGRASAPHWVGLSRRFWSRLDSRGACRIGSLELVEASTIQGTGTGLAIPDGRRYYPRPHGSRAPALTSLAFSAPAGHAVLLTNILHGYESIAAVRVRAAGADIAPAAANDLSSLYAPPATREGSVSWAVSFEATDPLGVDVVTFPVGRPPSGDSRCP